MMQKRVVDLQGTCNKCDAIRRQDRLQRYQRGMHGLKNMGRKQGR